MIAADERAQRLDRDVGGEREVARRDQLLRAPLGTLGVRPAGGEAPEDDEAGRRLDQRVEAEADERDRRRRDPRSGGDRKFDHVPCVAAPGKQPRTPHELRPLRRKRDRPWPEQRQFSHACPRD
jgi:hypothetical protein